MLYVTDSSPKGYFSYFSHSWAHSLWVIPQDQDSVSGGRRHCQSVGSVIKGKTSLWLAVGQKCKRLYLTLEPGKCWPHCGHGHLAVDSEKSVLAWNIQIFISLFILHSSLDSLWLVSVEGKIGKQRRKT